MRLEQLLEAMSGEFGASIQTTDGACTLTFDEMEISILEIPEVERILILGKVGELPPYPPENLYAALLMSNHLFQGTKGSTLSLDPETKTIYLEAHFEMATLNYEKFRKRLENFVNTLESWCGIVKNYTGPSQQDGAASRSDDGTSTLQNFMRI